VALMPGKSIQLVRISLISEAVVKQGLMAAATKTTTIGPPGIR
jgi:hypothetical protein